MKEEFEGLGLVELIGLLEDVPEPPEIALTPQTPGWIVVGILALVSVVLALRWVWRRRRANAYRRAALEALDVSQDDPVAIASILRRAALVAYPRSEVAALDGDRWLAFLDGTYPGSGFVNGPGSVIATAPYRPERASPEARRVASEWVRKHKVSG